MTHPLRLRVVLSLLHNPSQPLATNLGAATPIAIEFPIKKQITDISTVSQSPYISWGNMLRKKGKPMARFLRPDARRG